MKRGKVATRRRCVLAALGIAALPIPARADTYVYTIPTLPARWDTTNAWWDLTTGTYADVPPDGAIVNVFVTGSIGTSNIGITPNYNYSTGLSSLTVDSGNVIDQAIGYQIVVAGNETIGTTSTGGGYFLTMGSNTAQTLTLGSGAASVGNYTLARSGVLTVSGNEYLGSGGAANFVQMGGTNNVGTTFASDLDVGYSGSAASSYTISGGLLQTTQFLNVGYNGPSGAVVQSGGTVSVGSALNVGYAVAGGTYTLSGTGVLSAKNEVMNSNALSGAFVQTGGSNTTPGSLTLGNNAGTSGTYLLDGTTGAGTLSVAQNEYIGYNGSGVFTQQGGTHTIGTPGVAYDMYVGYMGAGTYNQSGGQLTVYSRLYIGYDSGAVSTFNQSGGTTSVTGPMAVGYGAGGGVYSLSGNGKLIASQEDVNDNAGTGRFTQSGGTNTLSGNLTIAAAAGTAGRYELSGTGVLSQTSAAAAEYVGLYGAGTFDQTGGSNSIAGQLWVAFGAASRGSYSLGSGNLSASRETVGHVSGTAQIPASFYQTGGTNTVNGALIVGDSSPAWGLYLMSAGSLSVSDTIYVGQYAGSNGTFSLTGSGSITAGYEQVGIYGTGVFAQSGGANSVAKQLVVQNHAGSSGHYDMSGGTLSSSSVYNNGVFQQTGGTASVGAITGSGGVNVHGGYAVGVGPTPALLQADSFNQASVTIGSGGTIDLNHHATPVTSITGSLIMTGGQLDLSNNPLQISYGTSPKATIRSYLLSGYNGGAWNGNGIMTSVGNADHALGYADSADGIIPSLPANTLQVQLAIPGDTNLDGQVNLPDLLNLVRHFGTTNADWAEGDLNYDGIVNVTDFAILARHFGGSLSPAVLASLSPADQTVIANIEAQVPEPRSGVMMLALAEMLLPRKRRHRS